LPQGIPPALGREARLRVDLPLRGRGSRDGRELVSLPARHGDRLCLEAFLEHLGEAYADHHLVVVLDGAPSHRSEGIASPENVSLLRLPRYSPELNPVERWFQEEFRRVLSNRVFETVELLQEALSEALAPYWRDPSRLRSLTGYAWWVEAVESLGHQ
jgi:transposase